MRDFFKGWGTHVVALVIFLGLVITYFAPVELEGKVVRQGTFRYGRLLEEKK